MNLSKRSKILLIITLYYTILLGNSDLILNSIMQSLLTYGILVFPSLFILSTLYDCIKNKNKIKIKKVPLILSLLILIWNIITIITGINIGIQSIKALVFLVVLLMLINIIINIDIEEKEKDNIIDHFLIAAFISMILGIIQYFTGIRLNTFDVDKYPGILGRINSTFYIATLYDKFLVLSGIVTIYMMLKNKFNYKYLFLLFVNSITIMLTFSRSGILVYIVILLIAMLLSLIKKRYLNTIVVLISLICMTIIPGGKYVIQSSIDFVYTILPVPNNLRINLVPEEPDNNEVQDEPVNGIEEDSSLQFRNYYKEVGKQFIKENPIFGIGYGNYSYLYNNQNASEYLKDTSILEEHDYMYPHSSYIQVSAESGIVGTILLYSLMLIILIYALLSKNFISIVTSGLLLIALLIGSYTEGLFNAKQYIIIYVILYSLLSNKNTKLEKKTKNNKITFLLLHLGYGGIESSTINTANALIDNYDIEIISFYKLKNTQANKLNKKVKVKYLYDGEPNREEFKSSLKEHKYLKTLKEGIRAVNILIKKKTLIINNIIDCDSKYIVSTRYEFSVLLSKYGNKQNIKIAQEHHYHNNDKKYINILTKKYNNIDYLFALTKRLEKDYKKFLKNNHHTKVVLVPNMLSDISNKVSNLEEKNIITVSRLDYGKKNDDIIRAFSKLESKDWKLYVIGDGQEYDNLFKLISELNLEDRVILTGYKNKKEIEEYMLKSSLFLMASLTEGLPMVLLEAMSYGIPCIAYETASGTNDIILDNQNGYIIKNRNEEEYIKKITKMIKDEKLRKRLGKNAKESSKRFSKEEVQKIWFKILK